MSNSHVLADVDIRPARSGDVRPNPYIGPRSFQRGENLYGRDSDAIRLINLLIAERILLLFSPSGAGKTSLIQANILPHLQEDGFRILPTIRVSIEPPSSNGTTTQQREAPAAADPLLTELFAQHAAPPQPERFAGLAVPRVEPVQANRYILSMMLALEEGFPPQQQLAPHQITGLSLADYLKRWAVDRDQWDGDVFIFDQFEEILTVDPTDQESKAAFFRELGEALRDQHRWALFVMREDYMPAIDPYTRFIPTRLKNTSRLDLLGEEAARLAIREPALKQGVTFTDAAVTRLVNDLRQVRFQRMDGTIDKLLGPYVEPVQLQVVCYRLWQRIPVTKTQIGEEDVQALGDVDSALGDYYADCVVATAYLTGEPERKIREWFGTYLITEQDIRAQVVQGSSESAGLKNRVIWELIERHLVRAERRRGLTWFELAHDRLIEPVRRNNTGWFDQYLSPLQLRAALWDKQNRPAELLLYGQALIVAQDWATDHAEEMNAVERLFLSRSVEAQTFLNDQERAVQQRHELRRTRWVAGALMALALVAFLAVLVAGYQWYQAQRQLRVAQAQRLSLVAFELLESSPETALLLALEAAMTDNNPVTERVLRQALDAPRKTWQRTAQLDNNRPRISSHSLSPDGQRAVMISKAGDVNIWNLVDSSVVTLQSRSVEAISAQFSPNGQHVLAIYTDGRARLWGLDTQDHTTFGRQLVPVQGQAFSVDGQYVLTRSEGKSVIRLWDTNGNLVQRLNTQEASVLDATFGSDGKHILTASNKGVQIWNIDGTVLTEFAEQPQIVQGLKAVFSPDHQHVLTRSFNSAMRLWSLDGTLVVTFDDRTARLTDAVFSPDGQRILTISRTRPMELWYRDGTPLLQFSDQTIGVRHAAFSGDGQSILVILRSGLTQVWSTDGEFLDTLGTNPAIDGAFSPDTQSQLALLLAPNGSAYLWDATETKSDLHIPLMVQTDTLLAAFISPDGRRVVTTVHTHATHEASDSGATQIRVFDIDGNSRAVFSGNPLAISPNGDYVVTGVHDDSRNQPSQVRLTNIDDVSHTMLDGSNPIFRADGQMLLTTMRDTATTQTQVWLWDLQGTLMWSFTAPLVDVGTFSEDGQYVLLIKYAENEKPHQAYLRGLDATTAITASASSDIVNVAVSPDAQQVVLALADGTTEFRVVQNNIAVATNAKRHPARSIGFSADGQQVVLSLPDGDVNIWGMNGELLNRLPPRHGPLPPPPTNMDAERRPERIVGETQPPPEPGDRGSSREAPDDQPPDHRPPPPPPGGWFNLELLQGIEIDKPISGHTIPAWHAVFDVREEHLATTSQDGNVHVWGLGGGNYIAAIEREANAVSNVRFSADSERLLIVSRDGVLNRHPIDTHELVTMAQCTARRGLTREELRRFHILQPRFDFAARRCE